MVRGDEASPSKEPPDKDSRVPRGPHHPRDGPRRYSQSAAEVLPAMYLPASSLLAFLLAVSLAQAQSPKPQKKAICEAPAAPPAKLEKVISQCQEEIKYALLQEALSVLGETVRQRIRRETFSGEEKRIAGCLLQCVYRKMKAVDDNGLPTGPALVQIFTEGVKDRNYYLATIQSVQQCLSKELQQRREQPAIAKAEGYTCDVAYDMFMCVSEQIELLCGASP